MSEDKKTNQNITFVEAVPPVLPGGKYQVQVTQSVGLAETFDKKETEKEKGVSFSKKKTFWVSAPRFSLDPTDIYSVYPPSGHSGDYQTTLPHVVLTRKTLPWERTLDGSVAEQGKELEVAPWMALLLFDEDEIDSHAIKVQSVQVKDLLSPPPLKAGDATVTIEGPKIVVSNNDSRTNLLTRAPWEKLEDPCNVIDVPGDLFHDIVPKEEDLRYLAHARQVEMDDKEVPGIVAKGWFSVVVGNRFPKQGKRNSVFLVSLEGFQDLLGEKKSDKTKVRLVVLTSWAFTAEGPNFLELMNKLAGQAEMLSIQGNLPDDDTAKKALGLGYVPLNHATRLGDETVSWYRGPLVPLSLAKETYNYLYESADAALRYDSATGFFDVSYAAAWQLGRILALHKPEFAQSLYDWRREYVHKETLKVAQQLLQSHLGEDNLKLDQEGVDELLRDDLMTNLLMELWSSRKGSGT